MRRLLVIFSAVGLLCGALGCECCSGGGHVHGRCDCDDGPQYGCHAEMCSHGSDYAPVPVPGLVAPPKSINPELMPKDDAK